MKETTTEWMHPVKKKDILRVGNVLYAIEENNKMHWRNIAYSDAQSMRGFDYGYNVKTQGVFHLHTLGEAVCLGSYILKHRGQKKLQSVLQTISMGLIGDTVAVWEPKGMFAIDHPEDNLILNKQWYNTQKYLLNTSSEIKALTEKLRAKLGKREENEVVYSEDSQVRFTPAAKIKTWSYTPTALAKNPRLIALVGGIEKAEQLAYIAATHSNKAQFREPHFEEGKYQLRIPGYWISNIWLDVHVIPLTEETRGHAYGTQIGTLNI